MAVVILALLGGVIGGVLLSDFGGFVFGLVVGAVVGWVLDLAGRVRQLERKLDARTTAEARRATETPAPQRARETEPPPSAEPRPLVERAAPVPREPARPVLPPTAMDGGSAANAGEGMDARGRATQGAVAGSNSRPMPEPASAREPLPTGRKPPAPTPGAAETARGMRRAALESIEPSPFDKLLSKAWGWFTTGNVPVKVGVVLSLFGVGFLVKEGIDRQWLVLPIEFRLMFVALFGIGLLVLGWRLRGRQRTYALSVQGGGIGVLFVTIYASYQLYDLLPPTLAFGLLVTVTTAAIALAVLQDSRALAVLGIVGGFMAPVLASSGSNNHVALFSYYALLDLAIVGIAWFKAWRVLNVLGFLFTFGIGTLWGAGGYDPSDFATTEPFLILFTAMYLVIPVLFAIRVEPPRLRGFVDSTLMFGTPIVAFALQNELVGDTKYGLAISAVALALAYVGMATYLYRTHREQLRVLVEAQLALGIAFVTIAVPLALDDALWTSAAWALEGAALTWLAFRQQRRLALAAGVALQALAGVAYVVKSPVPADWPLLNGPCLGALVLAFAGFFSARLFDPDREDRTGHRALTEDFARVVSVLLFLWAAGWWFFAGIVEVERSVAYDRALAALLVFSSATAVLSIVLAGRLRWPRLNWLGLTLWPSAMLLGAVALIAVAHPSEDLGWLAWPVVVGSMLTFLRAREALFPRLALALHAVSYWLVAGLLLWETHWLVERAATGVWPEAAVLALGAVFALATQRATTAVAWPFAANARVYLQAGCGALLAALTLSTLALNVESSGEAVPLPYLPLMNPLELASVLVLLALLKWLGAMSRQNPDLEGAARARPAVAGIAVWFLVTMTVARCVHHWAQVPYDLDSLASSTTFQSALSIVWGIAGLAAMIVGARSLRRGVWLVGAGLMSVVVVKLFLVDLGNTGTLARVVSFLGVGVLLLVVGYFAPVPPRAETQVSAARS
jgi:uncharacterized membrane protein